MDLVFPSSSVTQCANVIDFRWSIGPEAFMCLHQARTSVYVRLETFWVTGSAGCEVMGDLKLRGR